MFADGGEVTPEEHAKGHALLVSLGAMPGLTRTLQMPEVITAPEPKITLEVGRLERKPKKSLAVAMRER
jgi:hypothetical protein